MWQFLFYFRKGLPLNYLKHLGAVNQGDNSDKRKCIINKVKSLVGTLVDYIDVDSAADNLGRKFMYDAMPPLYSTEEAEHSCLYDGDVMKNGKVFNRYLFNFQHSTCLKIATFMENLFTKLLCINNFKYTSIQWKFNNIKSYILG